LPSYKISDLRFIRKLIGKPTIGRSGWKTKPLGGVRPLRGKLLSMRMSDPRDNVNHPNVNDAPKAFEQPRAGITLEAYAEHLSLPLDALERLGLATIENPWGEEQNALAIPYRRRDGTPFRLRIRQSLNGIDSKRGRSLWTGGRRSSAACSTASTCCR
jgi:hypothetical protein